MGSTLYSLHYHVVFSTKDRRPLVKSTWQHALHDYIGGTIRGMQGVSEIVGGVEDHVHILMSLKTSTNPSEILRELKKASSVWAAQKHDPLFGWQDGYGIFSVSWTHCPSVRRYIAQQAEHHRKFSYSEELKRLLNRNGVALEPGVCPNAGIPGGMQ
ncbi:MAG TPA: IS200/IS605 family transposase [Verrucomicrobiae bacterium]|nr:IS200/IS605 family transposase [Verrucomicrobiae bacterium]